MHKQFNIPFVYYLVFHRFLLLNWNTSNSYIDEKLCITIWYFSDRHILQSSGKLLRSSDTGPQVSGTNYIYKINTHGHGASDFFYAIFTPPIKCKQKWKLKKKIFIFYKASINCKKNFKFVLIKELQKLNFKKSFKNAYPMLFGTLKTFSKFFLNIYT